MQGHAKIWQASQVGRSLLHFIFSKVSWILVPQICSNKCPYLSFATTLAIHGLPRLLAHSPSGQTINSDLRPRHSSRRNIAVGARALNDIEVSPDQPESRVKRSARLMKVSSNRFARLASRTTQLSGEQVERVQNTNACMAGISLKGGEKSSNPTVRQGRVHS